MFFWKIPMSLLRLGGQGLLCENIYHFCLYMEFPEIDLCRKINFFFQFFWGSWFSSSLKIYVKMIDWWTLHILTIALFFFCFFCDTKIKVRKIWFSTIKNLAIRNINSHKLYTIHNSNCHKLSQIARTCHNFTSSWLW